jgi:hypothetical protein
MRVTAEGFIRDIYAVGGVPVLACATDGHLESVTIPDAV